MKKTGRLLFVLSLVLLLVGCGKEKKKTGRKITTNTTTSITTTRKTNKTTTNKKTTTASIEYTLTLDFDEGGSVRGSGNYSAGSSVSIVAIRKAGYSFLGWYDGETLVSENEIYTFTMPNKDLNLKAKFDNSLYVYAQPNDFSMGDVEGLGNYHANDEVTLKAKANAGFRFDGWYEGETLISNSEVYVFTMPEKNVNYTAKFIPVYKLVISSGDEATGTVTGGGEYAYNDSITITATAAENYRFSGWYEDGLKVCSTSEFTFDMPSNNKELVAYFEREYILTIVSNDETKGTVSGSGRYVEGEIFEGYADENPGYELEGWYDLADPETCLESYGDYYDMMPDHDLNLIAIFVERTFYIEYKIKEDEHTDNGFGTAKYNNFFTLDIPSKLGYSFEGWYDAQDEEVKLTDNLGNSLAKYDKVGNTIAIPHYSTNSYEITLTSADETKGTVSGSGSYEYKSKVTLVANPKPGYKLEGWYENDNKRSDNPNFEITISAMARTFVAKFTEATYTITLDPQSGTIQETSYSILYHSSYTLEVPTKTGSRFVGWYYLDHYDKILITDNLGNSFEVSEFTSDTTVYANYAEIDYSLSYSINDSELKEDTTGVISALSSPEGTEYHYDPSETNKLVLIANCKDNYKFIGWYENDVKVCDSLTYEFYMPARNCHFVAKFKEADSTIHLDVTGYEEYFAGTTYDYIFEYGESYTLPIFSFGVLPDQKFEGWKLDSSLVSTNTGLVSNWSYIGEFTLTPQITLANSFYFGTYPQSIVTGDMADNLTGRIDALPTPTNSIGWLQYDIRISTRTIQAYYRDIDLYGEKYRGVYFLEYIWDDVCYSDSGNNQTNNRYYIETLYWFKFEPIEWKVLSRESDSIMIITAKTLFPTCFNFTRDSIESYTDYDDMTITNAYPNNYQASYLRWILNDEYTPYSFIGNAFSSAELACIKKKNVINDETTAVTYDSTYICNNTQDKVFVLSYQEGKTYSISSKGTDYAKCLGLALDVNNNAYYWSRTPSQSYDSDPSIKAVYFISNVEGTTYVTNNTIGVMPVMWVSKPE